MDGTSASSNESKLAISCSNESQSMSRAKFPTHTYMRARTKGNVPIGHSTEIDIIRSREHAFAPPR